MNRTNIEWCRNPDGSPGYTWNVITGCLGPKGDGMHCPYCFAKKLANGRLRQRYLANTSFVQVKLEKEEDFVIRGDDPFYPRFWESRQGEIMGVRDGKGIFVCDMSDLFGIGIPEDWTNTIMRHISMRPGLRFYLLTKQPQNLPQFSPFPENCWVGGTVPNNDLWRRVIMNLGYYTEAKVKYISFEPLLERICLPPLPFTMINGKRLIDWVIIGACTGTMKDLLPLHHKTNLAMIKMGNKWTLQPKIEWVEEIVRACDKAGIPVFLKDNLKPILPWEEHSWAWERHATGVWTGRLRQELPDGM